MSGAAVVVRAAGAVTSVGTSVLQTLTSVRAGVARLRATSVRDGALDAVVMGLVPDTHLPPLDPALAARGTLTARQARLLRLARAAWDDVSPRVAQGAARAAPVYLGVAETAPDRGAPVAHATLLADLATQCPGALDPDRSRVVAGGRAAAFSALSYALADLRAGAIERAWVAAADSYLDLLELATLDRDARLKTPRRTEGFHPGEGAAWLLLARADDGGDGAPRLCELAGVGIGREPGHLGSDEPLRGDGLADAVRDALAGGGGGPVATVLAGLNGEYLGAREWGVAARRSDRAIARDAAVLHPAECYGDPGAAAGAVLMALGAEGLARGAFAGELLAWAGSDGALRGAARLRARAREA